MVGFLQVGMGWTRYRGVLLLQQPFAPALCIGLYEECKAHPCQSAGGGNRH